MSTPHERAMERPLDNERNIVMLLQAAHDLIEDGHGENEFQPAVILLLRAIRIMADDDLGRLDRDRVIDFADHYLNLLTEGGETNGA